MTTLSRRSMLGKLAAFAAVPLLPMHLLSRPIRRKGKVTGILITENRISPEPVNVLDFGAVGDGVHDDTAAIEAAIKSAEKVPGTVVFFPPTTYRISHTLSGHNVRLEGPMGGWRRAWLQLEDGIQAILLSGPKSGARNIGAIFLPNPGPTYSARIEKW